MMEVNYTHNGKEKDRAREKKKKMKCNKIDACMHIDGTIKNIQSETITSFSTNFHSKKSNKSSLDHFTLTLNYLWGMSTTLKRKDQNSVYTIHVYRDDCDDDDDA